MEQAILDMLESGQFGQGPAFWRWARSDAALATIAAFAEARRAPVEGEWFAVDLAEDDSDSWFPVILSDEAGSEVGDGRI